MGQMSRLQTDYDRLSLRNDLGLTKPELEQIAKRMVPPPAKVLLLPVSIQFSQLSTDCPQTGGLYLLRVLIATPFALSV